MVLPGTYSTLSATLVHHALLGDLDEIGPLVLLKQTFDQHYSKLLNNVAFTTHI